MKNNHQKGFSFEPVIADRTSEKFVNVQYLPFILTLFEKYRNILSDDYYPQEESELVNYLIEEINSLYPWFLICLKDGEPIGTVWISHWHGTANRYHSCQVHSYLDRKFWGKPAREAMDELLDILFNHIGVQRVQMEIPEFNRKAVGFAEKMGFVREGTVRCATIKDGKPLNHVLFSKLKGEHHGKKQDTECANIQDN